jgi:two-component sensor histidine kinase
LIVTELVINALKHAIPEDREGKIFVRYNNTGSGWQLSVSDTGVGTRESLAEAKPGLGTSIVEALASQLDATLSVQSENPGVTIKVTHAEADAGDQSETGAV